MTDVSDRLARLVPSEQTLVGYLFWLSRPRFWFYLAGPVIVGVAYGASTVNELVTVLTVGLFLYFLLPANLFLYGVNDIFDADIDRVNPKKSEDGPEVTYRGDRSVILAIAISTVLGFVFVPSLPAEALAALAGFYLLGAAYSMPPLRLKTTPFLDSVSNGLYILPGIVAFTAVASEFPPLLVIVGGWLWTMGMHTFSAIPDIEPDQTAGIQTTATVLGERRTLGYCMGCWLGAALVMGLVHWFFAAVFFIYPLFIAGIVLASIDITRAYWWFPIINTLAGTVLTLGGIWRLIYG